MTKTRTPTLEHCNQWRKLEHLHSNTGTVNGLDTTEMSFADAIALIRNTKRPFQVLFERRISVKRALPVPPVSYSGCHSNVTNIILSCCKKITQAPTLKHPTLKHRYHIDPMRKYRKMYPCFFQSTWKLYALRWWENRLMWLPQHLPCCLVWLRMWTYKQAWVQIRDVVEIFWMLPCHAHFLWMHFCIRVGHLFWNLGVRRWSYD